MKDLLSDLSGLIIVVVLFLGLIVGLSFFGLYHYGYFAPKYEAVRREVFEETRSYNAGQEKLLQKRYTEWRKAETLSNKKAIEAAVRHEFAEYNEEKINSPILRGFLKQTKYGTNKGN